MSFIPDGWLPWDWALGLAACFGVLSVTLARLGSPSTHRETASLLAREATTVSVLYSVWMLAGRLSAFSIEPAMERGVRLWDLERVLLVPSEAVLQQQLLPHPILVQAANVYYAIAHLPGMGIFLVWMFLRHRHDYARWRNSLATMTAVSLLIQLFPVAPPRLVPDLAMVDTALVYGQSVYSHLGAASEGQLQAMPSLHVGWAVLVGVASWTSSRSPWRFLGPIHAILTIYVVVVTGNHYWFDGLVACLILAPFAVMFARWGSSSPTTNP